ncbi:CLUMA_CG011737, isoform A [Clunio marinus]|uniref:RING-type E3 ubiquitin transferase n=1 Tax=Clunio marinus TaxID=568069 RepID=A0A1J1IF44_9DIPT|nr:CLUMA_CG011737, isoform A [Clunio marinus]
MTNVESEVILIESSSEGEDSVMIIDSSSEEEEMDTINIQSSSEDDDEDEAYTGLLVEVEMPPDYHPPTINDNNDEDADEGDHRENDHVFDINEHTYAYLYEGEHVHDKECSICLNAFIINARVRRLQCFHLFHMDCINPWCQRRKICPLCQQDIANAEEN